MSTDLLEGFAIRVIRELVFEVADAQVNKARAIQDLNQSELRESAAFKKSGEHMEEVKELRARLVASTGEQAIIDREALMEERLRLQGELADSEAQAGRLADHVAELGKQLEQAGKDYANLMIQQRQVPHWNELEVLKADLVKVREELKREIETHTHTGRQLERRNRGNAELQQKLEVAQLDVAQLSEMLAEVTRRIRERTTVFSSYEDTQRFFVTLLEFLETEHSDAPGVRLAETAQKIGEHLRAGHSLSAHRAFLVDLYAELAPAEVAP